MSVQDPERERLVQVGRAEVHLLLWIDAPRLDRPNLVLSAPGTLRNGRVWAVGERKMCGVSRIQRGSLSLLRVCESTVYIYIYIGGGGGGTIPATCERAMCHGVTNMTPIYGQKCSHKPHPYGGGGGGGGGGSERTAHRKIGCCAPSERLSGQMGSPPIASGRANRPATLPTPVNTARRAM